MCLGGWYWGRGEGCHVRYEGGPPNTHVTPTMHQNGSISNLAEPMRPTLCSSPTAQTGGLGDSPEGPKGPRLCYGMLSPHMGADPWAPDKNGRVRYKNWLIWVIFAGTNSGPWSWGWAELRSSVLNSGVGVSGAGLGQGP